MIKVLIVQLHEWVEKGYRDIATNEIFNKKNYILEKKLRTDTEYCNIFYCLFIVILVMLITLTLHLFVYIFG